MIVVMSGLLLVVCLALPKMAEGQKAPMPSWLILCSVPSLLLSLGILGQAGLSMIDESVGRFGTPSFRMGGLIPSVSEDPPYKVNVTYVQASWFGLVKEGRWKAKPVKDGGWKFLDEKGQWVSVPEDVWNRNTFSAEPDHGTDNRGPYEQ
jgi:hypothetical protein